MNHPTLHPQLTQEGITFTVNVDAIGRHCIVTREAMHKLSELKSTDAANADLLELFRAYEATISGVARRLIAAGVPGNPLVMHPATFTAPHTA